MSNILEIGSATLINDDWKNVLPTFKDNQFDWVLADPPYFDDVNQPGYFRDANRKSSVGVKTGDYGNMDDWEVPGYDYYNEVRRISKNQIIWGINYFEFAGEMPGRIVWDKVNQGSSFSDIELAMISSINSLRLIRYMWNGMMQGKSLSEGHIMQGDKKKNEKRIHVTQKPVLLYRWVLQNFIPAGSTILDTHSGSLSLGIASEDWGCKLTAIEKDTRMYNKAANRLKTHINNLKIPYNYE